MRLICYNSVTENQQITHITFDFFGTLVGYTHGHFAGDQKYTASHKYLQDNGYEIEYGSYVTAFSNTFDVMAAQHKTAGREFHMYEVALYFFKAQFNKTPESEVIHNFVELYISEWNSAIRYFPNTRRLLERLKRKYKLAIISNTHYPSLIHRNLEAMDISNYFDAVVTSVEFGKPKPDRSIFDFTVKKLATAHNRVIHIGDSYNDDYSGAQGAGIDSILIDQDNKQDKLSINKVNNLFEIEKLL